MTTFIREGGTGILVLMVWGLCTFAMAIAFAVRPTQARQGFAHAMVMAILMLSIGSTSLGLIGMMHATVLCRGMGNACAHGNSIMIEGSAEAINNLAMGCCILAFVAFVYAFGRLRLRVE